MSKSLIISSDADKVQRYEELLPQLKALLDGESDVIANLANTVAMLKEAFGFFWVGFYLVKAEQLVLGPFQGSLACTRIGYGKGVCGTAWKRGCTIVVPDVDQFEGHIACNSLSRSEIVVPVFKDGNVMGVLDIDSDQLDTFDESDVRYLEKMIKLLPL